LLATGRRGGRSTLARLELDDRPVGLCCAGGMSRHSPAARPIA
jgi:hypothetical protein